MGREFELKFTAEKDVLPQIRSAFPGDWQTISMETAYYDTPDGLLGQRRWTLRRRYENGKSICTVKTPCADGGRGEWETECDRIEDAIPVLCKLGCPEELISLTADGLIHICGAKFTRRALTIEENGCILELALDEGKLLGGGKELPLCEVEVELKSGTDADALAYARVLARKFDLRPEAKSKYLRALELAAIK